MEGRSLQLPEPQRRGVRDRWNDTVARFRQWPSGRPLQYPSALRWMGAGFDRQNWAFVAAIAAGWTALPIALYMAVIGAIVGGIGAVVGLGHVFGYSLSGPAESSAFIAFLAGAAGGDHDEAAAILDAGVDVHTTVELRQAMQLVAQLPERRRRIFLLHLAGHKYDGITAQTGDGPKAIDRQIRKARTKLRESFA